MRIHSAPATQIKRFFAAAFFCVIFSAVTAGPASAQRAPAATDANFGATNFPKGWTHCANAPDNKDVANSPSGSTCWFPGLQKDVIYCDVNGKCLILESLKDVATCNSDTFYGSPGLASGPRYCFVSNDVPKRSTYTPCAKEGGTCTFSGTKTVMYGVDGRYVRKVATGSIACNKNAMGRDPFSDHGKGCYVSP